MCGICGLAGVDGTSVIDDMTDRLAHRGPDGRGTRTFASGDAGVPAALGHRRLSIIDPHERGRQPMATPDGRYWITFNGEIYNYRELRRDLEAEGIRFRTQTDTEVLLALWASRGPAGLHALNGMFAFGVWDDHAAELFLVRDRLGVKPLYYASRNGSLAFASEVKALQPALGSFSIRPSAVADFLTFLWVPDPDTMFEGVQKLPPGHYARWSARAGLEVHEYWDLSFEVGDDRSEDWIGAVRDGVADSVQRQLVADVPVGAFLSGGIDSTAIVSEIARGGQRPVTYTVGFGAEDLQHEIVPDDVKYARRAAQEIGVDYHERTLSPDVVSLLPKAVWHLDEPVADPAAISTYLICSAAREQVKVVLSGMGGDEIFAGYPRHLAYQLTRLAELLPLRARSHVVRALEARLTMGGAGRMRGPRRNLMKLVRGLDRPPAERYLTYCSYYRPQELAAVLSDDLRSALSGHDPFRHHRVYLDRVRGEHWLNQLLYLDMKTFLPCLNLTYTDKMSMAASTEVRVPLLDDELVALAARVPPELKLRRLTRKYVFKRSQEGRLPREIIWRKKAGFGAPVRSWVVSDLKPMIDDLLSPQAVARRGLLDPQEVRRVIAAGEAGTEDNALRVWSFLSLELWLRRFVDENGAAP